MIETTGFGWDALTGAVGDAGEEDGSIDGLDAAFLVGVGAATALARSGAEALGQTVGTLLDGAWQQPFSNVRLHPSRTRSRSVRICNRRAASFNGGISSRLRGVRCKLPVPTLHPVCHLQSRDSAMVLLIVRDQSRPNGKRMACDEGIQLSYWSSSARKCSSNLAEARGCPPPSFPMQPAVKRSGLPALTPLGDESGAPARLTRTAVSIGARDAARSTGRETVSARDR